MATEHYRTEPPLLLRSVERSRGEGFLLEVPRLELRAGEVLCLLGPTGSGKSTLLRLAACSDAPRAGEVCLFGRFSREGPVPLALRRRIAMLFQRPVLVSGTVRQNVALPLRFRRAKETRRRVQALLDELGLEALAERSVARLSGGQAQLTALARTLVPRPDLLLLDEPTAGLDPGRIARVERSVTGRSTTGDLAVLWATHDLFQARRVADRVAFLLEGELVETAPAEELFERPRDPRTAAFLRGELLLPEGKPA